VDAETKRKACDHLRDVLRHRLQAWDASRTAEELLDCEINTGSVSVENAMAIIDDLEDVDQLTDERVLEIFEIKRSK
jgi:hypothetical protein